MELLDLITFQVHASLLSLRNDRLACREGPLEDRLQSLLEESCRRDPCINRLVDEGHLGLGDVVLLSQITAAPMRIIAMVMLLVMLHLCRCVPLLELFGLRRIDKADYFAYVNELRLDHPN